MLTAAEMAAVDAQAAATVPFAELVRRAGTAAAGSALRLLGGAYGRRVVVVAGKGHNGDDGRVVASLLARRGAAVTVVPAGAAVRLPVADLVVDAAYGTAFHGDYRAPDAGAGTPVLAVDLPSGVRADTGAAVAGAVRAVRTVTFGALKPGLLLGEGRLLAGLVELAPIGLPVGPAAINLVGDDDLSGLPPRRPDGHKWDAACFVVAGSPGMAGAAALAARGALRAGSGMVRLGSPGAAPGAVPVLEAVATALPADGFA
ncbi:MAG: bifunctional ADP-dependent NAD(P)H-hydrate dehydratase/NAD(P)H-hydrate epimerase, partial [Actinomycetota bacterium]|nr:bifunctional ADP-dependent NAD(P)H-hydrate dehydratase/NAD(P)H-hydrate epimerase [Actinomycetota bacterium]